ncbi:MAG: hypothetical protein HPZ91_19395 [Lentisphaeria bacterium]|nr:hypothetical protein [Lentisphaeria bacterium]
MRRGFLAAAGVCVQQPLLYFLMAVILALPPVFLTVLPASDVASRYAPMAAAFADGEWAYAFHPRVPPLLPVLGGVFAFLFRCDGFLGVRLASLLLYAFAVFPLFALFRRILPLRAACWGVLFYLFCHPLLQYAGEGLRDNGKTLALALAAWALLSLWGSPRRLRYYLWLGAGIGIGSLFRTELLVAAGLLLPVAAIRECLKKQVPWRTFAGGVVALLLLLPVVAVNRHFTGYPVPDVRLAAWLQQREKRAVAAPAAAPARGAAVSGRAAPAEAAPPPVPRRNLGILEYLHVLFEGFYPAYLLPVLLGAAWRIRRRQWSVEESVLACVVAGNAVVTALLILLGERYFYLSKRYLLPAAPLAFGWGGYFAISLWEYCRGRWRKWFPVPVAVLIFVVCAGILYGAALGPVIRGFTSGKQCARKNAVLTCAEAFRKDYRGESRGERRFLLTNYRSNRRPFVVVPDAVDAAPMLAGGSRVFDRRMADYLVLAPEAAPPSPEWRRIAEVPGYRDERHVIWGSPAIERGGK